MLTAVTEDEPQPSATPRGGFVSGRRVQVADEIEAKRRAALAELDVKLRWPSPAERASGVAAFFSLDHGGLSLEGELARGDTGLVISKVEVTAPLPRGITQRALKDAPLAGILRSIRAQVAYQEAMREGTRAFLGEEPAPGLFLPEDVQIPKTSGRTELTDELLRQVALAFIEETGPGKDKRAIQRMVERFDRPEGTLRTWISRARKAGWLAPGSKGRIGAEPGPKLIEAHSARVSAAQQSAPTDPGITRRKGD